MRTALKRIEPGTSKRQDHMLVKEEDQLIVGNQEREPPKKVSTKHQRRQTVALKSIGLVQKGKVEDVTIRSIDKSTERFVMRNQKMINKRRANYQTINVSREQKIHNDRQARIKTALNLPPKSNLKSLAQHTIQYG